MCAIPDKVKNDLELMYGVPFEKLEWIDTDEYEVAPNDAVFELLRSYKVVAHADYFGALFLIPR